MLLLIAAIAGCGGDDDGGGGKAGEANTPSSASADYENPPFKARVEITKDGYRPKNVRILVGGSVTFVNMDDSRGHTAETGDLDGEDPGEALTDNNEFDTHTLTWEEPYTVTFHKPEKVLFYDSFNPSTRGTVEAVSKVAPQR